MTRTTAIGLLTSDNPAALAAALSLLSGPQLGALTIATRRAGQDMVARSRSELRAKLQKEQP